MVTAVLFPVLDLAHCEVLHAALPDVNPEMVPNDRHQEVMQPVQPGHLTHSSPRSQSVLEMLERAVVLSHVHESEAFGECQLADHV